MSYTELAGEMDLSHLLEIYAKRAIDNRIHSYIFEGDLNAIKQAVENGLDLKDIDSYGHNNPPLMVSAFKAANIDIIEYLIEQGFDIDTVFINTPAYEFCVYFPYTNYYRKWNGDTKFYDSLERIFNLLKDKGKNIYKIRMHNRNLLEAAVSYVDIDAVKLAVKLGFGVNSLQYLPKFRSTTLIHECITSNEKEPKFLEIFEYLIQTVFDYSSEESQQDLLSDLRQHYASKGNDSQWDRDGKSYNSVKLLEIFNKYYKVKCCICDNLTEATLDKDIYCSECKDKRLEKKKARLAKNTKAKYDRRITKQLQCLSRYRWNVHYLNYYLEEVKEIVNPEITKISYRSDKNGFMINFNHKQDNINYMDCTVIDKDTYLLIVNNEYNYNKESE